MPRKRSTYEVLRDPHDLLRVPVARLIERLLEPEEA
ncbi:MAG: hypothetical protein QOJ21_2099 [Solirubrobacteraceae bacterium]|jgi:hypothetical protein|nr:hypothetical protein [Solirubrobacteraceae bacterium]